MKLKNRLEVGSEIEVQLCILGDVENVTVDEGEKITQHFTQETLQALVDNWDGKPIRVDVDHSSEITDNTKAAGWINALKVKEDGLYGMMSVSEYGAEMLNGLDYRYGSPAFVLDGDGNPIEMTSFALTNRPRMKEMKPVWNSSNEKADVLNNADAEDEALEVNTNVHSNEMDFDMDKLIQILGLPAEATEDDVYATVEGLVAKLKQIAEDEAKAEAEAAEQKLEKEAVEAVDECGAEEDDKKEMVNSYKKDPSVAKVFINAMSKMKKSVINFSEAKKPEVADAKDFEKRLNSLPGGQAKVDFIMNYKLTK